MDLDTLIKIIRWPIGLIGSIIVICFWVIILPIEFIIVMVVFPFAALLLTRTELRNSLLGSFPNTIRQLNRNFSDIWEWVEND
jgi:hypothetical protein